MSINQLPARLPRYLRPRREKVFGEARGIPLDRNAKARIMVYAKAWTAKHRTGRSHRGPITRAYMEVLGTLLWAFHNSRDGRCFPSFETIAQRAGCNRDTVYEAINVLEAAGIMTWVNRIARIRVRIPDLLGQFVNTWRIIRTSNAYTFRDPLPCQAGRPEMAGFPGDCSKSENPTGTLIQDTSLLRGPSKIIVLDPQNPLEDALIRLGRAVGSLPEENAPRTV